MLNSDKVSISGKIPGFIILQVFGIRFILLFVNIRVSDLEDIFIITIIMFTVIKVFFRRSSSNQMIFRRYMDFMIMANNNCYG